jgi:hypothetical protein
MEPLRRRRTAAEGLPLNTPDTRAATTTQAGASSPPRYQFLTIAGALEAVNSVLTGGTLTLAVHASTGALAASAPVG